MKLSRLLITTTILLLNGFVTFSHASDNGVLFSISPQKCVTLKQGRVCYLDLDVDWRTPEKGDYCVSWKRDSNNVKCWEDSKTGVTHIEFAHNEDDWLQLTEMISGNIIAIKPVVVKWVYKSRQKASVWRVF